MTSVRKIVFLLPFFTLYRYVPVVLGISEREKNIRKKRLLLPDPGAKINADPDQQP